MNTLVETKYYENTLRSVKSIEYKKNGQLHCDDGPAYTSYWADGCKHTIEYFKNGELHRANGPALVSFSGLVVISESYWENGKLNRLDGPAIIFYDKNGTVLKKEFWENGNMRSKE